MSTCITWCATLPNETRMKVENLPFDRPTLFSIKMDKTLTTIKNKN